MGRQAAQATIKGRPLVIFDCEDESLNRFLVANALAYRVPVNVLDNRELLAFYPFAIVDFGPLIIATGHVIANQIHYLRRCGFTHAAIKSADHQHWQQAHQAIRHHFQHMPDSPRSRRE